MIDVLMLTRDDWANTGYRFARCLRRLGLNVVMFKGAHHPFYDETVEQAPLHPALGGRVVENQVPRTVEPLDANDGSGLHELIEGARVVHFTASTFVADRHVDWGAKTVVVQHGGRSYRNSPEQTNAFFNRIADAAIIQCPDLLGLGAHNEHLIYYPVDTDEIQPHYEPLDAVPTIGHYPSSAPTKGSKAIFRVLEKLRVEGLEFRYADVPGRMLAQAQWREHVGRIAMCDIYIEALAPTCDGRPYGEWGNAALEAASAGDVVITHAASADVYKREYGDLGLHVANDEEQLEAQVRKVLAWSPSTLKLAKERSREWAHDNHGMDATARRLWDKVYRHLLPDCKPTLDV